MQVYEILGAAGGIFHPVDTPSLWASRKVKVGKSSPWNRSGETPPPDRYIDKEVYREMADVFCRGNKLCPIHESRLCRREDCSWWIDGGCVVALAAAEVVRALKSPRGKGEPLA